MGKYKMNSAQIIGEQISVLRPGNADASRLTIFKDQARLRWGCHPISIGGVLK
jgi:hypothetical protein